MLCFSRRPSVSDIGKARTYPSSSSVPRYYGWFVINGRVFNEREILCRTYQLVLLFTAARDSLRESTIHRSKVEDSLPEPVIEGLQRNYRITKVGWRTFPTSQPLVGTGGRPRWTIVRSSIRVPTGWNDGEYNCFPTGMCSGSAWTVSSAKLHEGHFINMNIYNSLPTFEVIPWKASRLRATAFSNSCSWRSIASVCRFWNTGGC